MGTDRTGLRQRRLIDTPREPTRTCVGCRGTDSWSALLRVVVGRDEGGKDALVPDPRRRLPGRGAWLHPKEECLDLAVRRKAFPRALRAAGPLDPGLVAAYVEHHLHDRPNE